MGKDKAENIEVATAVTENNCNGNTSTGMLHQWLQSE